MKKLLYTLIILFWASWAYALDVIPGLKVFGGTTRAAYGNSTNPTIYIVNTLSPSTAVADSTRNGVAVKTGGLDAILETAGNNKLIIFEVGGVIDGGSVSPAYITENYITIAGQTAPSPGIILKNYQPVFSGHDIVIYHIASYGTDAVQGTSYDYRAALNVENYSTQYPYNVVIDHCTFAWGIDGVMVFGYSPSTTNNMTISNSIIGEGLNCNRHSKGCHSTGMIIAGGNYLGLINNLFISNDLRNPYTTSDYNFSIKLLMANNLIYNAKTLGISFEERTTVDQFIIEGNVIEGGPDSGIYASDRVLSWVDDLNDSSEIYLVDNQCDNSEGTATQASANDWVTSHTFVRDVSASQDIEATNKVLAAPFAYPTDYTPMASNTIKAYVLANAGSRPAYRDIVTTRLIGDATNNTGDIIDTVLYTNANCTGLHTPFYCCTGVGTGTCDQVDEVGFPNDGSSTRSVTDIGFPSDPHGDTDADGYTNLEEWLHNLALLVESVFTISAPYPTSVIQCADITSPYDATQAVIFGVTSSENATCKFSVKGTDTCATAYADLDETFESTTDQTAHSDTDEDIFSCGTTTTMVVKCLDDATDSIESNCLEIPITVGAGGGGTPTSAPRSIISGGRRNIVTGGRRNIN